MIGGWLRFILLHEQKSRDWNALTWSGQPREEGQHWGAVGDEVGPDILNDMETCHEVEQKKTGYKICALVLRKKKFLKKRHLMPIALGDRIIADFVLMLLNTFLYLPSLLKWCVLL